MKKRLLSIVVSMMMLLAFIPAATAETASLALPGTAGEALTIEFEDYQNAFCAGSKSVTPNVVSGNENLSDAGAVYTGSLGTTTVTLPIAVNAEKGMFYDVEQVTAYAAHLSTISVLLDGNVIKVCDGNGGGENTGYTAIPDDLNYPLYSYSFELFVPAGEHTLSLQIAPRSAYGGTVAFAADYMSLTATDKEVPTIIFPVEESEIELKTSGSVVSVTYPNTAVAMLTAISSSVDAYDVQIYTAATPKEVMVYNNSFNVTKDENGNSSEYLTNHIRLEKFVCGEFVAQVTPTYSGVRGTPVRSMPFTIEKTASLAGTKLYELEDYWEDGDEYAPLSDYASGGSLILSAQGTAFWTETLSDIKRDAEDLTKAYSITYTATLDRDGTYDVQAALSNMASNDYVSAISVAIDDTVVFTNSNEYLLQSIGGDGTLCSKFNPLALFGTTLDLAGGDHTVTVTFAAPVVEAQPYLFAADYMEFIPSVASISAEKTTVVEAEYLTDKFAYVNPETGEVSHTKTAPVKYSANTSGGKYVASDSYAPDDVGKGMRLTLPIYVEEEGNYIIKVMDSLANSKWKAYLDGSETEVILSDRGVPLSNTEEDELDSYSQKWKYYDVKYHQGRRTVSNAPVFLTEGDHTLVFEFELRANTNNSTVIMDYIAFESLKAETVSVSGEEGTVIEMENYASKLLNGQEIISTTEVIESELASAGKLLKLTERPLEFGAAIDIPLEVEESGWYTLSSILSYQIGGGWSSVIEIGLDGETLLTNDQNTFGVKDLYAESGFYSKDYKMWVFETSAYITAGEHTLTFNALPRTNGHAEDLEREIYHRVCFYADNITMKPMQDTAFYNATTGETTVKAIYDDAMTSDAYIACYKGKKLVGIGYKEVVDLVLFDEIVACSEAPDTVKVFTLLDSYSISPLIGEKVITVQ